MANESKYNKYKVSLTSAAPLHVGASRDPLAGADNPVALVGGQIAIPGPSLKGALRAAVERYLIETWFARDKGSWEDHSRQPCIPSTSPSPDERRLIETGQYRHKPCAYVEKGRTNTICPACYFLGAMGLLGFVRVPFLYARGAREELSSLSVDRALGTGRSGPLFTYQLVPQNTTFTGTLTVILKDSVLGWELGKPRCLAGGSEDAWLKTWKPKDENDPQGSLIQEFIIERLESIKLLGGYKSKGFGEVSISVKEVK